MMIDILEIANLYCGRQLVFGREIIVEHCGDNSRIAYWNVKGIPQPTLEELLKWAKSGSYSSRLKIKELEAKTEKARTLIAQAWVMDVDSEKYRNTLLGAIRKYKAEISELEG
jgi:hypothetical protein